MFIGRVKFTSQDFDHFSQTFGSGAYASACASAREGLSVYSCVGVHACTSARGSMCVRLHKRTCVCLRKQVCERAPSWMSVRVFLWACSCALVRKCVCVCEHLLELASMCACVHACCLRKCASLHICVFTFACACALAHPRFHIWTCMCVCACL